MGRGALGLLARVAARGFTSAPLGGRLERFLLERTWTARSADMLDRYLVSGYQNPRINVQSILLRHFLITRIGGTGFDDLIEGELRLAVELNEALRLRAAELGVTMGSFLNPAKQAAVRRVDESIADREHAFAERWLDALGRIDGPRISVLELACGSANDYRAFVEYGVAPHLDYRGIDITEKNVMNARRRFPEVPFEVGDVRSLPYGDGEFDFVIASDVFEHLSLDGMELALDEAMRVARSGLALTFFNMGEAPEHEVRPTRLYHWNRLSRPRVQARLRERFPAVTAVPIAAWLRERHGYAHSYNGHAYSLFAEIGSAEASAQAPSATSNAHGPAIGRCLN
jgi:ubiquinone/menaquinone biosynthesis C-methylase UbiE